MTGQSPPKREARRRGFNLVPQRFEDGRHIAIGRGLARLGYEPTWALDRSIGAGDAIVTWNLTGRDGLVEIARAAGAKLVVAEEAYTRRLAPGKRFALALWGHAGSGIWPDGGIERWERLGIELTPWRAVGERIVVCGQRGIGSKAMASPPNWHEMTAKKLWGLTARPVVVRPHPGKRKNEIEPFLAQIAGAHAVVVWSSACGVEALVHGVPVFYAAPFFVAAAAARRWPRDVEDCFLADRAHALGRVAWAEWDLGEIESGEALERVLACA